MTQDEAKLVAARAALAELPESGVVGLGSGSTAKLFIDEVGALVKAGRKLVGVPTSEASRAQAEALGIPMLPGGSPWAIDVTVDGADEVSDALDLIKGGGAAHTREKIVNYASKRNVIIVDGSKLSAWLGEKWPVPVEVLAFAHATTASHLARHGEPRLRHKDGRVVMTDSGNVIYDVKIAPAREPGALDCALRAIPGVVETGLFVRRCDVCSRRRRERRAADHAAGVTRAITCAGARPSRRRPLHHEVDALERLHVLQRIARHGDEVGVTPRREVGRRRCRPRSSAALDVAARIAPAGVIPTRPSSANCLALSPCG